MDKSFNELLVGIIELIFFQEHKVDIKSWEYTLVTSDTLDSITNFLVENFLPEGTENIHSNNLLELVDYVRKLDIVINMPKEEN